MARNGWHPMTWSDILAVCLGTVAAMVTAYVGLAQWRQGKRKDIERKAAEDAARADSRDEERWHRLETDVTNTSQRLEAATRALDIERAERQTAVRGLFYVINQYIERETLWFGIYHEQTILITGLGGIPNPLPIRLRHLPTAADVPPGFESEATR